MLSPASIGSAKPKSRARSSSTRVESSASAAIAAVFDADLNRMSHIRSRQRRNQTKRELMSRYQDWIDTLIMSDSSTVKERRMFVWLLLWKVDGGDWLGALDMMPFALSQNMTAPEDFSRTLVELVVEQIIDGVVVQKCEAEQVGLLGNLKGLIAQEDVRDQVSAKLYKAHGIAYLNVDDIKALGLLEQAISLHPRVGVRRHINKLKRVTSIVEKKPSKKPRKPKVDIRKKYELSARAAAERLGVSTPTIIRHARKKPDELPHLLIPTGCRSLFRFAVVDVDRYKRKHLINKV